MSRLPEGSRHPEARNELALVYYKQGKLDEADRLCNLSLSGTTAAPASIHRGQALHYLALIERAKRNIPRAKGLFEEARLLYDRIGHSPGLAQLYDSLGSLHP